MDRELLALQLIDLGAASLSTRGMIYGADDSRAGLFSAPGLSID